ncbi:MAG TPA: transglutaminase domain-containing protein [Mycobacteriales bacterium]|nr:transglutaminase domain-containing protein [Mycobacteriales bacterium]
MTTMLDRPTELEPREEQSTAVEPEEIAAVDQETADDSEVALVTATLVAVSGALSALGAAWMVGGIFRGSEAHVVATLGVLVGGGLTYGAIRWRAPLLNYLVLPAALLLGAGLMSSTSGGGTSSLPALVKDAATSSQVLQPPVDFAPGWRLILVVVLAGITAAATVLALSQLRTRLAVAVPVPLTIAAALIQPAGHAVTTSAVSVAFVVMALATSYAADGVGETFDTGFELRRLGRSFVAGLILIVALVAASKVSFLFPDKNSHHVVPPRKPPVSPPPKDVPLYEVSGPLSGPLRAGVIDVYDAKQQAWLLPPVDNQRLDRLHLPAAVPGSAPPTTGAESRVTVRIDQASGHVLPMLAGSDHIDGSASVDYDPRTQTLALATRPVYTGLSYTLTVAPAPTGAQLSAATGVVPPALKDFLTAPPAPLAVEQLLAKAPHGAYAKLQYLRAALYLHFTAAGEGKPTDVSADRVAQLLAGGTGNPYELSASEALLARWAGLPSRIGYGYYNGQRLPNGSTQFRPTNAATYLEVYLAPYGWVPVIGTPPKAQESLSSNQQRTNTQIKASPDLGLQLYLPVRQPDNLPVYEYARYYAVRALPVVAAGGLLLLLYPVVLKRVRRRRRRQWAAAHGPGGRIAVAYCELRDLLVDLALPGRGMTPLELVQLVDKDEEHAELAWLVTRGLWGDLRDQLTDDDADVARQLAGSVAARIAKAQPETARLLAAVSRASLRRPFSAEVPNVWWQPRLPKLSLRVPWKRLVPGLATPLVVLLAVLFTGGCAGPHATRVTAPVPMPTRLAPSVVAGLTTHAEDKATQAYVAAGRDKNVIVGNGEVLSFSRNGLIQAALQVGQLKTGYLTTDSKVVRAITASFNSGGLITKLRPQGTHVLYASTQGSQRLYLWFPTTQSMALLVVRSQITEGAAESLARALIDYGDGLPINETALTAAFATSLPPSPGATVAPVVAPPPSTSPTATPSPR